MTPEKQADEDRVGKGGQGEGAEGWEEEDTMLGRQGNVGEESGYGKSREKEANMINMYYVEFSMNKSIYENMST